RPRSRVAPMYKTILIATDGSDLATHAATHAVSLAKALNAKVVALTVTEPFRWLDTQIIPGTIESYLEGTKAYAAAVLREISRQAGAEGVTCEILHLESEFPDQAIIETADLKGCVLIVMGSHGRRGISAVVLGSVTHRVLGQSKIPVLVTR